MNFFVKKLPWSKKRDVLSAASRDLIIARLNPLQEIAVRWGNKNQVTYSDVNVVIELDSSMAGSGSGSGAANGEVAAFTVSSIGTDRFVATDGTVVAFPSYLRTNPAGDASLAQIVPGLKAGMVVYAENAGSAVTGISDWLWMNNEGMAWGLLFRFKDSANGCAPMKCFVVMSAPVRDPNG